MDRTLLRCQVWRQYARVHLARGRQADAIDCFTKEVCVQPDAAAAYRGM